MLTRPPGAGRSVLIHDEAGGHQAVSRAEFLPRHGCAVEIATPDRRVGRDMGGSSHPVYPGNLARSGVAMAPNHRIRAIARDGNHLCATLGRECGGPDAERLLDIGHGGAGIVAENHHVGLMHVDHADIGPAVADPVKALALLKEAGQKNHAFDLISQEGEWQANSCNDVAEQMRAAGCKVKRTVRPGATFWKDWDKYPLPPRVQGLGANQSFRQFMDRVWLQA